MNDLIIRLRAKYLCDIVGGAPHDLLYVGARVCDEPARDHLAFAVFDTNQGAGPKRSLDATNADG